jgi:hypothetical protein
MIKSLKVLLTVVILSLLSVTFFSGFSDTFSKEQKRDLSEKAKIIKKAEEAVDEKGKKLLSPLAVKGLKEYTENVFAAREKLRKDGVMSKADKGVFAADIIGISHAVNLLCAENTKTGTLKECGKVFERLAKDPNIFTNTKSYKVKKVKIKIKGKTVTKTVKIPLAKGIVQFTKKPYRTLVKRYPDAKLVKDFAKGTGDTINAIKALHLLTDQDILCLKSNDGNALAAAYNGGCKQGKRIIAGKGHKMPAETIAYVKKTKRLQQDLG